MQQVWQCIVSGKQFEETQRKFHQSNIHILCLAEYSSYYQPNWTSVDGLMFHIQLTLSVFLIEKMDPVEIFGIMIFSLYFDSAYWYLDRTC